MASGRYDDSDDQGLAGARVTLSRQRTALSLCALSALLIRLTGMRLGLVGVATLATAMVLSSWAAVRTWASRHPTPRRERADTSGAAQASLAIATALIALASLADALTH